MCLRVRWSQEIVQEAEMTSESTTFGLPFQGSFVQPVLHCLVTPWSY